MGGAGDALQRQFLFICGCARSGTTALTVLLNHHPQIALGIERFIHLTLDRKMSAALFEPARFARIEPGDTYYTEIGPQSRELKVPEKFPGARIVGDKVPRYFDFYDDMQRVFPKAKYLFIARDIHDVAASYKRRLLVGKWDRDVARAIREWNRAVRNTIAFRERAPLHVVQYDALFGAGDGIDEIAAFVGVDAAPLHAALPAMMASGARRREKRDADPVLTPEERHLIDVTADFAAYQRLLAG